MSRTIFTGPRKWSGRDYSDGALFTLRVNEGENLDQAAQLRIFHAFGDPKIAWQGTTHEVPREQTVTLGAVGQ